LAAENSSIGLIQGVKMKATPREVLLVWVKATLQAGKSDPRPDSNRASTRLLVKELEHLALALQANPGEEP
jgi:hypothetical protein